MRRITKIELGFTCDEKWDKMKPFSIGRHCSNCQKIVVDFSAMSDAQIVAFFSLSDNEKACGRFRVGQLDYLNKGLSLPPKKEIRSFFFPFLIGIFLSLTGCKKEGQDQSNILPTIVKKELVEPTVKNKETSTVTPQNFESTTTKTEVFTPRKNTRVDSLKAPKNLPEVLVTEMRDEQYEHRYRLTGIPKMEYEPVKETTRFEQFFNKIIHPQQKAKENKWWNILRFRKKENTTTNP